jgi:hypothetical protein
VASVRSDENFNEAYVKCQTGNTSIIGGPTGNPQGGIIRRETNEALGQAE